MESVFQEIHCIAMYLDVTRLFDFTREITWWHSKCDYPNDDFPSMLKIPKLPFEGRLDSQGSPQISSAIRLTNANFFRWSSKLKGYPLS